MEVAILVGFVDEFLTALAVTSHRIHNAAVARAGKSAVGVLAAMVKQALERCGPRFHADIAVERGRVALTFQHAVRYKKPFFDAVARNAIPCLDSLTFDDHVIRGFAATLNTATFTRLTVHTHHSRDLRDIFYALAGNSSLVALEASSFTEEAWPALEHGLEHNTTLRELNLDSNKFGSSLFTSVFAHSHLRALGLAFCDLDTPGALRLAKALRNNSTVVWLNVVGNYIGTFGLVELITNSSTRLAFLALRRNFQVDKQEIADARRSPLYIDILDSRSTRPSYRKLLLIDK